MENRPRLRDSKHLTTQTLYPLNVFPEDLVNKIGGYLVYLIYIGRKMYLEMIGEMLLQMQSKAHIWIPLLVLLMLCWTKTAGQ